MFGGALTAHIVDLSIPDLGIPLVVERYYHSLGTFMAETNAFCTCMFNFEEHLYYDETDNSYTVIFPNRSVCRFVKQGNNYVPSGDNNYNTLEDVSGDVKILTFKNGWKHRFDNIGRLIGVHNRTGQSVVYEWTQIPGDRVRLTRITGASGRSLEFSYDIEDMDDLEFTITDWTGRTLKYTVTEGYISRKTDPEGNVFTYVEKGETFTGVQSISPPNGTILTNEGGGGSPLGVHVMKQTPGVGADYNYQYDWDNCRTTVTRGDRKWEYHFDKTTGLLERAIDPMNYERTWTRDEKGNVTGYTDAAGRTSTYAWDDRGNLLTAADHDGNMTAYEYNDYGQVTKITDPYDAVTEMEYDADTGNLLTLTKPGDVVTTYEYYDNGLLKKVTGPTEIVLYQYEYDNYGNTTKIICNENQEILYRYSETNSLIKETLSSGDSKEFLHNLNEDLTKIIDSNDNQTLFDYDGNGNIIKTVFSGGSTYTAQFNVMNDMVSSTSCDAGSDGETKIFEYDQYRQLIKVIGPGQQYTQYSYDKLGRIILEENNTGWSKQIIYDPYIEVETSPEGKVTERIYDSWGKLTSTIYNDGSYNLSVLDGSRLTTTQFGERYGEVRYGGNDYGSITFGSLKYGGSGVKYGYDPENNIVYIYDEDTGKLKFIEYPGNKTVSYQYDGNGFITGFTDIRGYNTKYEYDENDRIKKAVFRGKETLYTYDSQSRLSMITLPNGIVKSVTYQNETGDIVKQIKYENESRILYQLDLEYDKTNILKTRTITKQTSPSKRYSYLYDHSGKLVGIYLDGRSDCIYLYDTNGRLSQTREENGGIMDYYYDSSNRLSVCGDESYEYNADGNKIRKHKISITNPTQYVYDNQNKLTMVIKPDGYEEDASPDPLGPYTWRYRYYPQGQTSKIISPTGRELRFYYDRNGLLINEEGWNSRTCDAKDGYKLPKGYNEDSITHVITLFYGAEVSPIGIDTTPTHCGPNEKSINYYLTDNEGSIIALSDSFGNIIKFYEYDKKGNRIETDLQPSISNPHTVYNPLGKKGVHAELSSVKLDVAQATLSEANTNKDQEYVGKLRERIEKITDVMHDKIGKNYACYTHAYVWALYKEGELVKKYLINIKGMEDYKITDIYVVGRYPRENSKIPPEINYFGHYGVVYRIVTPDGRVIYLYHDFNDENREDEKSKKYDWRFSSCWWYGGINGFTRSVLYLWDSENYTEIEPKTGKPKGGSRGVITYFEKSIRDEGIPIENKSEVFFEKGFTIRDAIKGQAKTDITEKAMKKIYDIIKKLMGGGRK